MKKGSQEKILEVVEGGTAECVPEYELEMSKGELKEEFKEIVNSKPKQSLRETMRDFSEKLKEMNPDKDISENAAMTVFQGASKFKGLIKKDGSGSPFGVGRHGNKRRTKFNKTFKLKSLDEFVTEIGEQIINPTKAPSIASNEVEFFKNNATTSLFQQFLLPLLLKSSPGLLFS